MKKYFFTLATLLLTYQLSVAQDCFPGFTFYQEINIQPEVGASTIPPAVHPISFNGKSLVESNKLTADGSDLRIVDMDCNQISFYFQAIAERDTNVIYLSLPEIPVDGITIQVYYGSLEVQESVIDGNAVFEFFDDFEDSVFDTDKWEIVGAYDQLEEIDGKLLFTGTTLFGGVFQYVTPKFGYTYPITTNFVANANSGQVYGIADTEDLQRIGLRYDTGLQTYDTLDIIALMADTINGGFNPGLDYPFVQVKRNLLNIISIGGYIGNNTQLNFTEFTNHSSQNANLDTLEAPSYEFAEIRPFFSSFGTPIIMEYVGISASPEAYPIVTFGPEEMVPSTTGTFELEEQMKIYPNPASKELNIDFPNSTNGTLAIFDLTGQLVFNSCIKPQIDLSGLSPGSYVLKITLEEGSFSNWLFICE